MQWEAERLADLLDSERAENQRLRERVRVLELTTSELSGALSPFVELTPDIERIQPQGDDYPVWQTDGGLLTQGDFVYARDMLAKAAALAAGGEGEE